MGSTVIPEVKLNHGERSMPGIGLGTASFPFNGSEATRSPVLEAIRLGYRHFDTAALYFTEIPLGEAIAEALQQKLIYSREELFITSKLWCQDAFPNLVLPALKKSLESLQLDYLDLYLIHWPVSMKPGEIIYPCPREDFCTMDFKSVWEAMEQCQMLGLAKSIGVSNFSSKKLDQLLSTAKIVPSVNQVEMHPVWQQKKLRDYCKANGIHICAYSPLGGQGTPWGANLVMENELLQEIANKKGKTVAQVALRWILEQGVTPIVKSFNVQRLKQNLEIFAWSLTEDETQKIEQIPQKRIISGEDYISPYGPYRTLEEIWDGDI